MHKNLERWLILNKIPDLGTVGIKKLWDHFVSIEEIWKADKETLSKVEGLSQRTVNSILENRDKIEAGKELQLLNNLNVLTFDDEDYPKNLINIYDPPSVLYLRGDFKLQDEKAIAIVGTRRASHYGKTFARKLAAELAGLGLTIVSGMALGIDTAAHEGALEASGRTISVLGCGVDMAYPPSNKKLMQSILNSGAVISEFPPATKPENWMFPQRNRIISGLSLGVIVVEGHYDSGAMITAKLALDQGREVFAVPGNVGLDQSKGPHWLIKQGAKLVESMEDVLEELNMVMPKKIKNEKLSRFTGSRKTLLYDNKEAGKIKNECVNYCNLSSDEQKIVSILSLEPKHIDSISIESSLSIPQVSSLLMMLEVKKVVRQLPGKMFVLSIY